MKQSALGSMLSRSWTQGRRYLRYVTLAATLAACGGALGGPTAGGESHFLKRCEDRCGSGLECISGICTQSCIVGDDAKCRKLASGATCTAESVEPGVVAVCDLSCDRNADCSSLGTGFSCDGGFCRGPALSSSGSAGASSGSAGTAPGVAGSGSAGSGAGGAGVSGSGGMGEAGTAGSSSPGVACNLATNAPCEPEQVCVDNPNDACDGNQDATCSGTCREAFWTPGCSGGFGAGQPCFDGFSCALDPRTLSAPDQGYICIEDGQRGACGRGEVCADGFTCVTDVGDCAPDRVDCASPVECDSVEQACPYGYARSRGLRGGVASCYGPCVPVPRCECASDVQCPNGTTCDRTAGTCVSLKPWQPPSYCSLPFQDGPCDRLVKVFVFENGECVAKNYSGCSEQDGNANRFSTIEECMAICAGQPLANACPAGYDQRPICAGCGPVDNCVNYFVGCAQPCQQDEDCDSPGLFCQSDGYCNASCP